LQWPSASWRWALSAVALTQLVVPVTLIDIAERWAASSLAGILVATVPMLVLLVAPLFGVREPLVARRILGLVVGFGGVVALLGIDPVTGPHGWAGVACLLVAALGYATGPLIVQRHLAGASGLGAAAASMLVAALVLLPAALLSVPAKVPSHVALASILVLGGLCSACGLWLYFWLIAEAGAARAAIITYINPAVASLLGVGLLHEHFGAGAVLGLLLILLGSWWATQPRAQQAPA
jgi:drug/metabolite transporter (DMT)-like permease